MHRFVTTILLLCGSAAAQSTWTVDAAGGADFTSLTAAVAAPQVVDGDTLLVEPAFYGHFTTSKSLAIIGRAGGGRPWVYDESRIDGAGSATIAGIDFQELMCFAVPGRLVIEDCDIGHTGEISDGLDQDTFRIEGCAEVVVSNALLQGKTGNEREIESPGCRIRESRVAFVNCTILGGHGGDDGFTGFPGQPGLAIESSSSVTVAGCSVTGGDGGSGLLGVCQTQGGNGLDVTDSALWLRGNATDVIAGGLDCPSENPAFAVLGTDAQIVVSGVALQSPAFPFGQTGVTQPSPAEAFLWVGGNPEPGGPRRLNVAGPSGATALLLFSLQPLLAESPKLVGGPLWLDPGATLLQLPLGLIGQQLPITVNLPLPTDGHFAGVTAWVQGFLPVGGGKYLALNPASIVLRF